MIGRMTLRVLTATVALTAGCGPETKPPQPVGTVSGRVLFHGRPVRIGTVVFMADDGSGAARADIGVDGRYRADHVPAGHVRVALQLPEVPAEARIPRRAARVMSETGDPGDDPSVHVDRYRSIVGVPSDYTLHRTSGLSCDLEAGDSLEYDIRIP